MLTEIAENKVEPSTITETQTLTDENMGGSNLPGEPSCGDKVKEIIKKFDSEQTVKPKIYPRSQTKIKSPPEVPVKAAKPAVPPRSATTKLRGRLDKSHSTPAYDLGDDNQIERFVLEKSLQEVVTGKFSRDVFLQILYLEFFFR